MRMFAAGTIGATVTLLSLVFLKKLEPIVKKDRYLHLTITTESEPNIYPELERISIERKLRIQSLKPITTSAEKASATALSSPSIRCALAVN